MGVLKSKIFTEGDAGVLKRLEDCATGTPNEVVSHFTIGQSGEHIRKVQEALKNVQRDRPGLDIPAFEANGKYDKPFADAIGAYKKKRDVRNHSNQIDKIVGIKTMRELDDDNNPTPRPTTTKADITTIAAEIKKELADRDDRDLEFLARLFEEDRINDTATGNELPDRLNTILAASADPGNGGVTHFSGIFSGVTDKGFRTAFQDPFPGKSDNQVGHFMTAVDMGFRPGQTFALVPKFIRDSVTAGTPFPPDETICVRLIVGHEQVADDADQAFVRQAASPSNREIVDFFRASIMVTASTNQPLGPTRAALSRIEVGTGQGNSFQDLQLSCFGFRFGKMIREGTITTRRDAAQWIRTNIGEPNQPLPPGPPTG